MKSIRHAVLAAALSLAAPAFSADWPGWRGPNRDGKSPDTGLLKEWPKEGPKQLWKVSGLGKGFSTVAVVNDVTYVTGDSPEDGKLYIVAFDKDGKQVWRVPHASTWTKNYPGSRSTPVIDNGKLYIVAGSGTVGCYDAKDGKQLWTKEMKDFGGRVPNWGYAESVLIHENTAIITPGGKSAVVALDKNTGQPAWQSTGFEAPAHYSSAFAFTFEGAPLIAVGTNAGLICLNAKTGAFQFKNDFSTGNTANIPTPAYADGYLFWANGYKKGAVCVKLKKDGEKVSAEEAYRTTDMVSHHGGYVIHEGHVYGNHEGGYTCLELATGKKKWFEKGPGKGSLCWADNMLFLFGEKGGQAMLATCSPERMEVKGQFSVQGTETSWAHPVVINGRLYLRYADNLYCFDVKGS